MVMGELPERSDVVVVGGGPGGYSAAFRAAQLGLDVTLVSDEDRLGGVCLLRGCIPSKALLEVVEIMRRADELADWGVDFADRQTDVGRLRERTEEVVAAMTGGLEQIAKHHGIRRVRGRGRFVGGDRLRVSGDDGSTTISFGHAIVAAGSRPTPLPDVSFGDRIMDSTAALELHEVPERLLVVGGGYVGLELGTVYAGLGSRVTVVEATDQLLPGVDADLVAPLQKHLDDVFDAIHLESTIEDIDVGESGITARFGDENSHEFDSALVAVGRRPNTDALGIEETSVELDDDGFIVVDEHRRSTDRKIYAVGDIAGGNLLAHEAFREGEVAAEAIAGVSSAFDARAVPAVVYTDPQVAWCGITEREAAAQDREVEVATFPWRASGRALTMEAGGGLTKLIADPGSGRLLGVGIVGRGAESLISEGVLAIEMGAVITDLALTVHPHPTLSESLNEAAARLIGQPRHLAR
ncbi:MAG: dihydrolipoyl dehydrogenase [Acidimicrobiales bacterium]